MTSGRRRRLAFPRQPGRYAEAGEPDVAGGVDEHVRRLDVLVDEAMPVRSAQRLGDVDGEAQKPRQFERPSQDTIERLAAGILEHEHRPALVIHEGQRLNRPRWI